VEGGTLSRWVAFYYWKNKGNPKVVRYEVGSTWAWNGSSKGNKFSPLCSHGYRRTLGSLYQVQLQLFETTYQVTLAQLIDQKVFSIS
jgi:hypothetical protein